MSRVQVAHATFSAPRFLPLAPSSGFSRYLYGQFAQIFIFLIFTPTYFGEKRILFTFYGFIVIFIHYCF
jgi:hypothetical protein